MPVKPNPPPFDMEPRDGKKTLGNRRTGNSRGINSRRHAISWEKDPMILGRMALIEKLWAQGFSSSQMVDPVNDHMKELGVPPVSLRTIKRDKARILIRFEEEEEGAKEEHIESLKLVKRKAWDAFDSTPSGSLNKSSYLNTIRATEETIAKLDGTFSNKIKVEGNVDVRMIAGILADVLVASLDANVAEEIITVFNERVAAVEAVSEKPE